MNLAVLRKRFSLLQVEKAQAQAQFQVISGQMIEVANWIREFEEQARAQPADAEESKLAPALTAVKAATAPPK